MRARTLGIAALLVLAVLAGAACGDDGEGDDTGTDNGELDGGGDAGDGDAGDGDAGDGDEGESGDEGEGDEGDGDDGDGDESGGNEGGEGPDLSSYADAEEVASALGCADTFELAEAPEDQPGAPAPTSIGFCQGLGEEPMLSVFAEADMPEVRLGVERVSCQILPGFTWVIGGNWLVTPYGEPDPVVNAEIARTLGGELIECP